MTSDIVELDIPKFRAEFPQFSDPLIYTDLYIETKWALATCYISDLNCGYLKGSCRQYAIFLMLAHLIALDDMIKNNVNPNFVTSSSEGRVSASFQAPPSTGPWDYWLGKTSYGQQLNALLAANAVGGWYVGGSAVGSAFRGLGGRNH